VTDVSTHADELEEELARRQTELVRRELEQLRRELIAGERQLAKLASLEFHVKELAQCVTDLEVYREMHSEYLIVLGSQSWRLTAPLRRAGAMLRRRRG
jgi:hypothetical protein